MVMLTFDVDRQDWQGLRGPGRFNGDGLMHFPCVGIDDLADEPSGRLLRKHALLLGTGFVDDDVATRLVDPGIVSCCGILPNHWSAITATHDSLMVWLPAA
ncbi:hypothetical protein AVL59_32120 [Streptomyces griseochromogenes]|uniref:Uncharacterized protein n=1 Tax=Streptomyces griseochromogenes TaxID=68214 RepID=A0A1B1B440_9ACTN|nr:hypothetical protein AVL59_32120 [Streptomyces griseochromogenes]